MPKHLSANLIYIDEKDNVAIVRQRIPKDGQYTIDGCTFSTPKNIPIGFKIASENISKNSYIYKYHVPIGIASSDILKGMLVHTHNIKSTYLKAVLNKEQQKQTDN